MSKLQQLRKAAGLSQSQLAEKSGVNVNTLRQYEHGTRNINGMALISARDLARALGVAIEELIEE